MAGKWTVKDVLEAFEKAMEKKPQDLPFTNEMAAKVKEIAERNKRV